MKKFFKILFQLLLAILLAVLLIRIISGLIRLSTIICVVLVCAACISLSWFFSRKR